MTGGMEMTNATLHSHESAMNVLTYMDGPAMMAVAEERLKRGVMQCCEKSGMAERHEWDHNAWAVSGLKFAVLKLVFEGDRDRALS